MPKKVTGEEKKELINKKTNGKLNTEKKQKNNVRKTNKNDKNTTKKSNKSKTNDNTINMNKTENTTEKEKNKISKKPSLSKIRAEKKDAKKDNRIIKESDLRKEKEDKEKKEYLQEYYDLPYRYDETIVTILAQTPKRLFVYWDVSDKDKEKYKKAFGDDFFEKTYPVLLIHNEELNYTFEVPINDFANSWYLDIKDSKTKYVVQLGRKFRSHQDAMHFEREVVKEEKINLQNDFIYITDSNKLEAPNDHILFERLSNQVTYRNMKNGNEFNKTIDSLVDKLQNAYPKANLKDLYKELYGDEIVSEEGFTNPGSSGEMPTSSFRK